MDESQRNDAEEETLLAILKHIAPFDRFDNDDAPSAFVVYAHDSPLRAGHACADRARSLIEWLRRIRSKTLSDKKPLPLYATADTDSDVVRNIVSNQLRLLPQRRGHGRGNAQCVNHVIVCGSTLLETYSKDEFSDTYIEKIEQAYYAEEEWEHRIRRLVDEYAQEPAFHHILTELAFLRIRQKEDPEGHGIIPVLLDDSDFTYLPFLRSADLRLTAKPNLSGVRDLLFKLLHRLYPQEQDFILTFQDAYSQARKRFQQKQESKHDVSRIIDEELKKADSAWYDHTSATSRHHQRKPRQGPVLRDVPFLINTTFVGRASVVDSIKKQLFNSTDDQSAQRLAIEGLGGVGKTRVALEIAHWAKEKKPDWSLLWLPATSQESFEQACLKAAQNLGIAGANAKNAKKAVQDYFQGSSSGQWLLIVDNADNEDLVFGSPSKRGGIYEFLPRSTTGRILLTTRQRRIATKFARTKVVKLDSMSPGEAKLLLESSIVDKEHLDSNDSVDRLLDALTYLPLTISHAASYLNENAPTTIPEYISLLEAAGKESEELLFNHMVEDDTPSREAEISVAQTWIVSFKKIQENPNAAWLLFFIANIEPKAIPRSILPSMSTEQQLTQAIAILCGYSFLSMQEREGCYDMHRLVHQVSHLWVEKQEDAVKKRQAALTHLQTKFNSSRWVDREKWRPLLPHVLKAIRSGDRHDRNDNRATEQRQDWGLTECQLGFTAGNCMMTEGRHGEAIRLLERVVEDRKPMVPETEAALLWAQHELVKVWIAEFRCDMAIPLLEHVVRIRTRELSKLDSALLWSKHELGRAYKQFNRVKEAIRLLEGVVQSHKEAKRGETNRELLLAQHELAMAYMEDRRAKDSIQLFKKVLATYESFTDEKDSGRLWTQLELARAYQLEQDGVKQAIPLLQKVVSIRSELLPESHPHRLQTEHTLALALLRDDQAKESADLLEHVVGVYKRTMGPSHAVTANAERNLGIARQAERQSAA